MCGFYMLSCHLLQVKIIYSAWLRDKTWPAGTVVADSDEVPVNEE